MKEKCSYILVCILLASFAINLNAQSSKELTQKAREQRKNGRYDDALVTLLKIKEKYPNQDNNAEINWLFAQSYYEVNFFSESLRYYEKIAAYTEDALSYSNLAGNLGQRGYDKRAMIAAENAISADPDYISTYTNRGMIHAYHYRTDKALDDFYFSLENNSTFEAETKYNLAVVYHSLKDYEKREALLVDHLSMKNGKPENALFLEQVRMLKDKNYKPSKSVLNTAREVYSQKVSHNWYDFYSICKRGECYTLLGHDELARKDYLRAVELLNEVVEDVPDAWRYTRLRGVIYSYLGEKEKAIKDFEYVLSQNPAEASVVEKLAREKAK